MKALKILVLLCSFSTALLLIFFYVSEKKKYLNEVIKVKVSLKNNCELYDSAFMVTSIPEKKTALFVDGVAILYLKRSSKVKLAANKKFKGFHYTILLLGNTIFLGMLKTNWGKK